MAASPVTPSATPRRVSGSGSASPSVAARSHRQRASTHSFDAATPLLSGGRRSSSRSSGARDDVDVEEGLLAGDEHKAAE